jgi:hypothetical protein
VKDADDESYGYVFNHQPGVSNFAEARACPCEHVAGSSGVLRRTARESVSIVEAWPKHGQWNSWPCFRVGLGALPEPVGWTAYRVEGTRYRQATAHFRTRKAHRRAARDVAWPDAAGAVKLAPDQRGGMPERLIGAVLKTAGAAKPPGVRIPLPPPQSPLMALG